MMVALFSTERGRMIVLVGPLFVLLELFFVTCTSANYSHGGSDSLTTCGTLVHSWPYNAANKCTSISHISF